MSMAASASLPKSSLDQAREPRLAGIPLRPYQREALDAIERAAARGLRRVLLALPTGSGKTVVFAHLLRRRRSRALVLAHRDELLEQAAEKLCAVDPSMCDRLAVLRGGGSNAALDAPIVIASVQTLTQPHRIVLLAADFSTVVIDEAHHATAPTYKRILDAVGAFAADAHRAPLVLGVTATPERGDGESLGSIFQAVVYRKTIAELVEGEYLCRVRAVQVSLDADFAELPHGLAGDFADQDLERVLLDADAPAHAVTAFREHGTDRKRALLFAPTVRVSRAMVHAFRSAGIAAEALHGDASVQERRAILARLRAGTTRVLANVSVLTEGFDEPSVDTIIVGRPTRSRMLYCQIVGRGLRTYPGKRDCLIIDLVGATTRHDLVTARDAFDLPIEEHAPDDVGVNECGRLRRPGSAPDELVPGTLVSQAVDVYMGRALNWVKVDDSGRTSFVLSLPDGWLRLEPCDTRNADPEDPSARWNVIHQRRRTSPELLARGLAIGYAQGVAEDLIRNAGIASVLFDPRAAWRTRPATAKQRLALDRLGIETTGFVTAGHASDLISAAWARR
jgi:superfamily II DNA or RNA helicase